MNTAFPFTLDFSRYICLLLSDDSNQEVREEALGGLRFKTDARPSFESLARFSLDRAKKSAVIRTVGPFSSKSFSHVLVFLRFLLLSESNSDYILPEDVLLDEDLRNPSNSARLQLSTYQVALEDYIGLLDKGFTEALNGILFKSL